MKGTMTKKGILLLVAVGAIAVYTAFDWSCSGNTRNMAKDLKTSMTTAQNCESDYRLIAERDYFYSSAGAVAACDSFLNLYQYKRSAYCDDVREMRTAFREMGETLRKIYYSYEDFKTEMRYMSQRMAESPYRVVRDTWVRLLMEEDSCRLRAALTSLTDYDFKVYLHDYAQQVCQERYGHGLFALRMNDMKLARMSQPMLVDGTAAVTCTAEYDVHLDGPLGLGLRTRTEHLAVTGELGYTPEGRLLFHRGEASAQ